MPSTAIRHIGYDSQRHELFVTFVPSGKTYVYYDVPEDVFHAFVTAESRGSFFNALVRERYDFEELNRRKAG
jgi:hypothetical protein